MKQLAGDRPSFVVTDILPRMRILLSSATCIRRHWWLSVAPAAPMEHEDSLARTVFASATVLVRPTSLDWIPQSGLCGESPPVGLLALRLHLPGGRTGDIAKQNPIYRRLEIRLWRRLEIFRLMTSMPSLSRGSSAFRFEVLLQLHRYQPSPISPFEENV